MHHFERRRDRFNLFHPMESSALNLTFTLELPDFRPWCKVQGLAPFHVLLCAVLRSVMKIENFRYRLLDGDVICIDRLMPSYTVLNHENNFNFAQFEWSDDLREFVARSQAARVHAEAQAALNDSYLRQTPREAKERVYVTCIPWLAFTSIQHPIPDLREPDIPSLAWGRFSEAGPGRLQMPFSVQVHHGFVDGHHIHLLSEQIAAELAAMMQA